MSYSEKAVTILVSVGCHLCISNTHVNGTVEAHSAITQADQTWVGLVDSLETTSLSLKNHKDLFYILIVQNIHFLFWLLQFVLQYIQYFLELTRDSHLQESTTVSPIPGLTEEGERPSTRPHHILQRHHWQHPDFYQALQQLLPSP